MRLYSECKTPSFQVLTYSLFTVHWHKALWLKQCHHTRIRVSTPPWGGHSEHARGPPTVKFNSTPCFTFTKRSPLTLVCKGCSVSELFRNCSRPQNQIKDSWKLYFRVTKCARNHQEPGNKLQASLLFRPEDRNDMFLCCRQTFNRLHCKHIKSCVRMTNGSRSVSRYHSSTVLRDGEISYPYSSYTVLTSNWTVYRSNPVNCILH